MALTNAGRDFTAGAVVGDEATLFDNSNAHIGVGDSTTAFAAGQTDLQAASNKVRKGMEATFPTRTTNVTVFKSEFVAAEGNFAWEEWGIFNAASAGTMLNRLVENNGTKSSPAVWQLELTITWTIGT